jgi:hypothetical protein
VRTVCVWAGFPTLGQGKQLNFLVVFALNHPGEKLQDCWFGGRVDPTLDLGPGGMWKLKNNAQLSRVARVAHTHILEVFMKFKCHWISFSKSFVPIAAQ